MAATGYGAMMRGEPSVVHRSGEVILPARRRMFGPSVSSLSK
jgi:hypothetical protein